MRELTANRKYRVELSEATGSGEGAGRRVTSRALPNARGALRLLSAQRPRGSMGHKSGRGPSPPDRRLLGVRSGFLSTVRAFGISPNRFSDPVS